MTTINDIEGVTAEQVDHALAHVAALTRREPHREAHWLGFGQGLALAAGRISPSDAFEPVDTFKTALPRVVTDYYEGLRDGASRGRTDWPDWSSCNDECDWAEARALFWNGNETRFRPRAAEVLAADAVLDRARVGVDLLEPGDTVLVPAAKVNRDLAWPVGSAVRRLLSPWGDRGLVALRVHEVQRHVAMRMIVVEHEGRTAGALITFDRARVLRVAGSLT